MLFCPTTRSHRNVIIGTLMSLWILLQRKHSIRQDHQLSALTTDKRACKLTIKKARSPCQCSTRLQKSKMHLTCPMLIALEGRRESRSRRQVKTSKRINISLNLCNQTSDSHRPLFRRRSLGLQGLRRHPRWDPQWERSHTISRK